MDGSMRLWDLGSGDEMRSFWGYPEGVGLFSVAFSPDGHTALSGPVAVGNPIILWDLKSGEIIHSIDLPPDANSTALFFNPDGRTAYGSEGPTLYDLETGQAIRRYSSDCCTGFAIHPDGRTAFVVGNADRILREWNLETDREVRVFGEHKGNRTRVALNPDVRTMLSSGFDGTLFLWDLEAGNEIRRFASYDNGFILDIAVSPDGRTALVPGSNGAAILWRLDLPADLDEVHGWIEANRFVRELTCEERETYRIEPLCEE
jgi:WD40 repeat protein